MSKGWVLAAVAKGSIPPLALCCMSSLSRYNKKRCWCSFLQNSWYNCTGSEWDHPKGNPFVSRKIRLKAPFENCLDRCFCSVQILFLIKLFVPLGKCVWKDAGCQRSEVHAELSDAGRAPLCAHSLTRDVRFCTQSLFHLSLVGLLQPKDVPVEQLM